jgi:hypothetical protein
MSPSNPSPMTRLFPVVLSLAALAVPAACSSNGADDSASNGGAGTGTGGSAHITGGAPLGEGGAPLGEGGAPLAEGGVPYGEGGAPLGEGGAGRGTGGSAHTTGGARHADGGAPQGQAGEAAIGEGGSDSGRGGAGSVGSVPAELVGIWQETRASGGEYRNSWGDDFNVTSGFSVELRIRETGEYYFAHSASGVRDCGQVSYLDHSTGFAVLDGTTLVLHPTKRRLEVQDCTTSGEQELANDPIPLTIGLEESRHFYSGLRTYSMNVEGGPQPFQLTLLHRPPLAEPPQPEPPADFVLGTSGPFNELQGLWVPSSGTDSDFFDPATGVFYLPELNGSPHHWLRFAGTAYETAVALQNINAEGVCKSDAIYYEQGEARFEVLEDVGEQGVHFVGHARLQATAARLIINIRECGPDNAVLTYDVAPQLSYYRWLYFSPGAPPERITMDCGTFAQSEWQTMLCDTVQTSFYRRE